MKNNHEPLNSRPACKLSGTDGNVFNIIGRVRAALAQAGLEAQAKEFVARSFQARSYDAVIQLTFDYVEVNCCAWEPTICSGSCGRSHTQKRARGHSLRDDAAGIGASVQGRAHRGREPDDLLGPRGSGEGGQSTPPCPCRSYGPRAPGRPRQGSHGGAEVLCCSTARARSCWMLISGNAAKFICLRPLATSQTKRRCRNPVPPPSTEAPPRTRSLPLAPKRLPENGT